MSDDEGFLSRNLAYGYMAMKHRDRMKAASYTVIR